MAKTKKIPMRQCIGCHESKAKKDLIRVVKTKDGELFIDKTGKKNGRGAYLCDDLSCLKSAIQSKALNRSFKTEIPDEILQALEDSMKE